MYLVALSTHGIDGSLVDVLEQEDLDVGSVEWLENLDSGRSAKGALALTSRGGHSSGGSKLDTAGGVGGSDGCGGVGGGHDSGYIGGSGGRLVEVCEWGWWG